MADTDQDEQTATGRHRSGGNGQLVGLLLIGLGTLWLLSATGLLNRSGESARGALLMLLGAALIYTSRRGRGGGRSLWPIVLGVILIFSLLHTARRAPVVGLVTANPQSIDAVQGDYGLAKGSLSVDLREVPIADLQQRQLIRLRVGSGDVTVTVPSAIHLVVLSHVGRGQAEVCGQVSEGVQIDPQTYDNGLSGPALTLDIAVAKGTIRVDGCEVPASAPTAATPPSTT